MEQAKPLKLAHDIHGNPYTAQEILSMRVARWMPSRKFLVLDGLAKGLYTAAELHTAHGISEEELQTWVHASKTGLKGLRLVRGRYDYKKEKVNAD